MKNTILFIAATLIAFTAMAQTSAPNIPGTYVETVLDAATLNSLSHDFSIDRVKRNADNTFDVRIWLSYKDIDQFQALNIPYQTMSASKAQIQMAQNYEQMTANWNRYPTYSTYLAMMDTFQTRYPQLCKIDTILATTPANHSILVAHISNNLNDNEGKPSILYTSTIHGDEVTGYYMMLRLIDYLLSNYGTNSYVTELVNTIDIWICPLHNPDGTYYSSNNQINTWPYSIRANMHGEDLNRSFPEVSIPAKPSYEPEVEAMINFTSAHNFTLAANLHGGAEVFNYPWDTWTSYQHSHADADWWYLMGRQFADTCHKSTSHYMTEEDNGVTEGGDWYVITGSFQDWHNFYVGTRHVTIEVSEDKILSNNRLSTYWGYIYRSFLNFMAEAKHGIHGTVTDSLTGEPLQALIYIANHDLDHSYVETALPYGDYHRPIKAGQYAVTYSAEGYLPKTIITQINDGEQLIQNVQLSRSVGIDYYDSHVKIYPNPAWDVINIDFSSSESLQSITLYDLQGRMIETRFIESLQQTTLDVSTLPAGSYILEITINGQKVIRKIQVK